MGEKLRRLQIVTVFLNTELLKNDIVEVTHWFSVDSRRPSRHIKLLV